LPELSERLLMKKFVILRLNPGTDFMKKGEATEVSTADTSEEAEKTIADLKTVEPAEYRYILAEHWKYL
jgi:hypothetical protein